MSLQNTLNRILEIMRNQGYTGFDDDIAELNSNILVKKTSVLLNDSQIKTLPTIPQLIIPAPGPNKIIVPLIAYATLNLVVDTGAYEGITGASLTLISADGDYFSTIFPSEVYLAADDASQPKIFPIACPYTEPGVDDFEGALISVAVTKDVINSAIYIADDWGGLSDYTAGDPGNTLKVDVLYHILDL